MPKVSIIVPVYNVERYFDQCAQSLLNQTCKDIEIIFVDDGSTDNCPAMCDKYREQYPDIVRVVHQKNQSQNVAWNNGLKAAEGQWISFVDSDDWVELNMVETMLSYAENDDADIHVFGHYKEFKDGHVCRKLEERTLPENEKANFLYKDDSIPTEAWGRLFKRSFIEQNKLCFYPGHFQHEDVIFNLYAFHQANRVCLHPETLYHYRMVASGFIKRWDKKRIDIYLLYIKRYSEFADKYFDGKTAALMKQKHILDIFIYWFEEFYNDPRSGFTKKETVNYLKEHFNSEAFKPAIKEYPLNALGFSKRVSVFLLRLGWVRIWLILLNILKHIKKLNKKGPEVGYE